MSHPIGWADNCGSPGSPPVGLPVDQLPAPLARLALDYPGAQILVFGFGDRAFYMAREENLGQALAALFPGPGVILLTALRVSAPDAFGADT